MKNKFDFTRITCSSSEIIRNWNLSKNYYGFASNDKIKCSLLANSKCSAGPNRWHTDLHFPRLSEISSAICSLSLF